MDIATLAGLIGGSVVILFGTLYTGLSPIDIINIPALMITFGGGIAAAIVSNPLKQFTGIPRFTRFAFISASLDKSGLIMTLVSFSERARREGLLALEDDLVSLDEPFLKKGIQLVVDGTDPELVRNILETDINNIQQRHNAGILFWGDLGNYLPAFGMIGTLIGLVQMLKNLGSGDPSAIGTGMAAALITTLYGTIGANLIALPIEAKLRLRDQDEVLMKSIMLEGILSIQSGDNPRIVQDKLSSFLPPAERSSLEQEERRG